MTNQLTKQSQPIYSPAPNGCLSAEEGEWVGYSSHPLLSLGKQSREWEAMVIVALSLEQKGRVRFRGSIWFARCTQQCWLQPGERVRVVGFANITLWVEPIERIAN